MSTNRDSRQIARNSLASYMSLAAQLVSGVLVTPLLFRDLGPGVFGMWALITTVLGYVGLLELGVGTATVRAVAAGEHERAGPPAVELASARSLYRSIALAAAAVIAGVAILLPDLSGAAATSPVAVRLAIVSVGVSQLTTFLLNVFPAYLLGVGRADVLFSLGALATVASSVAQVIVAETHGGLVMLAVSTSAVAVCGSLASAGVARRFLGRISLRQVKPVSTVKRQLLKFGLKNSGVAALSMVTQLDLLVVGAMLSTHALAAYAVAYKASSFVKTLATRGCDVLLPSFVSRAEVDRTRQLRLYGASVLVGSAILIPVLLLILTAGPAVLRLWLGDRVARGTNLVLLVLVVASVVQLVGHVSFVFFNGRGNLSLFLGRGPWYAGAKAVMTVVLTLLVGVVGPALASLVVFASFDLLQLPRAVARELGLPARTVYRSFRAIAPAFLAGAMSGPLIALRLHAASNLLQIGLGLIGCIVFYGVLAWALGPQLRTDYRRLAVGALRQAR